MILLLIYANVISLYLPRDDVCVHCQREIAREREYRQKGEARHLNSRRRGGGGLTWEAKRFMCFQLILCASAIQLRTRALRHREGNFGTTSKKRETINMKKLFLLFFFYTYAILIIRGTRARWIKLCARGNLDVSSFDQHFSCFFFSFFLLQKCFHTRKKNACQVPPMELLLFIETFFFFFYLAKVHELLW